MSVIGGVLLYVLGVATGGGLVIANRINVHRETSQLRRENEHLKSSAWQGRIEYATHKAYSRGYRDGRMSPANDAERFAEFIDERNIDFRGQRRRERRAETSG